MYAYRYDPAGNRTAEQIDDTVTGATHDQMNRLVSQQPAGGLQFAGNVSEPAVVTVQGVRASVAADSTFRATAPVASGTNVIAVTATDPSGNAAAQEYEVENLGTARAFTYDANGNLTSDGARTFEWDARNQLVAVTVGTHRSEFTYDGLQRRVGIVERESGLTQSDTKVIWCLKDICEERAADGVTVTRRSFGLGEQLSTARFHVRDHLGSTWQVMDITGAQLVGYAFDRWGRRTLATGTDMTDRGFTGHRQGTTASSWAALYRAYDAEVGRWFSRDPAWFS